MINKKIRTLVTLTTVCSMLLSTSAMAAESINVDDNLEVESSLEVVNDESTSDSDLGNDNSANSDSDIDSPSTDEGNGDSATDSSTEVKPDKPEGEGSSDTNIPVKPAGDGNAPGNAGDITASDDGSITFDPILNGMLNGGGMNPGHGGNMGPGGMPGHEGGMGPGGMPGEGGDMGPGGGMDSDTPMGSGGNHGSETKVEAPDNTVPEGYTINSATQGNAGDGEYAKLFDSENLVDVNINVSDDNWNYLLQNGGSKPYVLASSFSIGDETIGNVGIKTKGNSSLSSIWSSDSDRYSFAINTSKYIKAKKYGEDQNFYGATKIALNNIMTDSTMLKEYLSYQLMKEMGVDTPLCSLVRLNVNGEYYGLYCMVEMSDESMAQRMFGSTDGDMYKPESRGGSLAYNSNLDDCLNEDGTYDFDISTYGESANPLTAYSGLLENKQYGDNITDYKKEKNVQTDLNEMFSWMKKLNDLSNSEDADTDEYKESMGEIVDVDKALRYFAANTYLVSMDSYQGNFYHNYILYLVNGKATVIPWDYNMSFGGFGMDGISSIINFSIDNPVQSGSVEQRPLLNALLKNSDYRAKYEEYLKDCTEIVSGGTVNGTEYEEDNFNKQIDEFKESLADAVKDDPTAFYTYDEFIKGCDSLKILNNQRNTAVLNQINDDFTTVDDGGIVSSDLGSMGGPGGPGEGGPNGGGMPGMSAKGLSMEVSDNAENDNSAINNKFVISVTDDNEYDLSKLRIRYYYTKDSDEDQNCVCDHSGLSYSEDPWYTDCTSSVNISAFDADTNVENIDSYYEVSFNSDNVLKSSVKLTVNARISNSDWSAYDKTNDFSGISGAALYYDGHLVGIYSMGK